MHLAVKGRGLLCIYSIYASRAKRVKDRFKRSVSGFDPDYTGRELYFCSS